MPPAHKPYKPATRAVALDRYYSITEELAILFGELATVQQSELEAKSNTWMSSQTESITARDRYATAAALNYTVDIHDIRLSISALEAERLYLDQWLKYAD